MAQRSVELTLAVDKWDMGWGDMSLGWAGWGAEHAHGLCLLLPFFCCPACPQKVRNGNCERGCEGKSIPKKSSLSGWRGVPSHKRARVQNNFKIEYLLLKRKVFHWQWFILQFVFISLTIIVSIGTHSKSGHKCNFRML